MREKLGNFGREGDDEWVFPVAGFLILGQSVAFATKALIRWRIAIEARRAHVLAGFLIARRLAYERKNDHFKMTMFENTVKKL